jgi:hypothetical protein
MDPRKTTLIISEKARLTVQGPHITPCQKQIEQIIEPFPNSYPLEKGNCKGSNDRSESILDERETDT